MSDLVDRKRVLLTGGSGYVGGRLRPLLEQSGWQVRCLARRPEYLAERVGAGTEVVAGDVLDADSLAAALADVDTAFYLVHSMSASGAFEEDDRTAAQNFAQAARLAGVRRIIYLGGLGDEHEELSPHLRSRQEVGRILLESGAQLIEFRASIVIGSGSLSFELIRALVERLPVMICPKWVHTQAQPIAIEDLLAYLMRALEWEGGESRVFEIGGPAVATYGEIMQEYARQRGLRRWLISVPVLTPRLSSLWLGLVTPVYARVGRKLIESLKNPTVVKDYEATTVFPMPLRSVENAIKRALVCEDEEIAATRWSDANSAASPRTSRPETLGNRIVDTHQIHVAVAPRWAFQPIRQIGGQQGWYYANFLWKLRGWMDLLFGGIGLRRGRRDPEAVRRGDVLDWWRVEDYQADRRLRLFAEMKVPGRAWLEFEVAPSGTGSDIRQTALFDPRGLLGRAYWYLLYPLHYLIFRGMLREIGRRATHAATASGSHAVTSQPGGCSRRAAQPQ